MPGTTINGSQQRPAPRLKRTTLEGGIRVPFVRPVEGDAAGRQVYDQPVIQLDILPTALAAAGVEAKPEWKLDGVNLLPYLTGKATRPPHDTLYWRFGEQMAIRQGDWKLVRYDTAVDARPGPGRNAAASRRDPARLYNLARDLGESQESALDQVDSLKRAWREWEACAPPSGNRIPRPGLCSLHCCALLSVLCSLCSALLCSALCVCSLSSCRPAEGSARAVRAHLRPTDEASAPCRAGSRTRRRPGSRPLSQAITSRSPSRSRSTSCTRSNLVPSGPLISWSCQASIGPASAARQPDDARLVAGGPLARVDEIGRAIAIDVADADPLAAAGPGARSISEPSQAPPFSAWRKTSRPRSRVAASTSLLPVAIEVGQSRNITS